MTENGQIALVTGGTRGIGRQVVADLAAKGYTVFLGCRSLEAGISAAAELADQPGEVVPIVIDVTDDAGIAAAAETVREKAGRLDVLVNNAGISGDWQKPAEATRDTMRQVYETNVYGPIAVTRAMMPLLRESASKTVVNVTSELGSLGEHSNPDFAYGWVDSLPYCSSKAALNAFTVLLAKQLRQEGFRVNSVNPGFTATEFNDYRGTRKVEQASAVVVHYATLGESGPTGGFFTDGGMLPW
ncbi:SDR family NAD(P)-dependent oxidoreductase [Pseudoruegeria sp. HB172150]|uniref:SDR family NAD(P)-dependent oxidoreductase n=1 Tax=Pseudoruegeria sp. HB172150 TaxID=2721164 RepID=UPI0015529978|nr:SDR family NAD(P)-dependent oxidoreductase [Pseudoruegeria sp. HB172150]